MLKPKTKVLLFDAAGTLFQVRDSVGHIYQEVALRYGVTLDLVELNSAFKIQFPKMPPLCFPNTSASQLKSAQIEWWKDLVSRVISPDLFSDLEEFNAFFETLFWRFTKPTAWELYPEVYEVLTTLTNQRGFLLRIVSNFDFRLHEILKQLGIHCFFDQIICSGEIGLAKPQREIFQFALPENTALHQAAFIGDDFHNDIQTSHDLGLNAIWVRRKPEKPLPEGHYTEITTITTLSDLIR